MQHDNLRFLTDIRISQSSLWTSKTRHIGSLPNAVKALKLEHLLPVLKLLLILKNSKKYDCVINGDLRTAQLFGLVRALFRMKFPRHIVLELMLDEEQKNVRWKLKNALQKFIFSSVDLIFVSSKNEINTYAKRLNISPDHIKFVPFHTNITEPALRKNGNYIFSAGRTGRDYRVLAAVAESIGMEVVIVSDEQSVKNIRFPANVRVHIEVAYAKYLELLYQCRYVVIPLKKVVSSTGQVVLLEAMAAGKAVIATDTVGTRDYITSGVNGILVPPDDPLSIKKAIDGLAADPALAENISLNGLDSVKKKYLFEHYTSTILNTAEELINYGSRQRKCAPLMHP